MTQLSTKTLSITDFKMVKASASPRETKTLAKVIIAFTGRMTKDEIQEAITAKLNRLAAPVENSFRIIKAGVAVGFVRANKEIRVPESKEQLRANYRVMSSNILMDNNDKTLWAVKQGAGGTYLTRHGEDDLSELVNASVYRRNDVPGLSQVAMAGAARGELAAFVDATGDMDYGFVTATSKDKSKVKVVSARTRTETIVPVELCASFYQVAVPAAAHKHCLKAGLTPEQKQGQIKYYQELFKYAPEYLRMIEKQINDGTNVAA
ncbi:hypothetical protein [Burkholderia phage BCSR5]|nr:hypothetical protein [Burkholderia phage BCSR5]